MHGFGRLILASGDVYTGFFRQGMRNGEGKEVFASGEVEEGTFEDDEFVSGEASDVLVARLVPDFSPETEHSI